LGVWDTEANNGVLIYLLLADRSIEIVADRGLSRRVGAAHWQAITTGMGEAFRAGRFEDGLNAAVDAVSRALREHFPLAAGESNPNELPDAPVLR
ncbi:MAG: TPM domain-containing protein, partial [Burkholderiales bacterium]